MNKIVDLFIPFQRRENINEYYAIKNQRLLVSYIILTALSIFGLSLISIMAYKPWPQWPNITAIIMLAIFMAFNYRGKFYTLSAFGFVLGTSLFINTQYVLSPGSFQGNPIWTPVLIFAAITLLGKKKGLCASIAILLFTSSALVLASTSNSLPLYELFGTLVSSMLAWSIGCLVIEEDFKIHEGLQAQKLALAKEQQNSSSLLAILGHDICTPVTIIDCLTRKGLKKTGNGESAMDELIKIDESTRSIKDIISQVRKFKTASSGKMRLKLSATDLVEAIEVSIEAVEQTYPKKNINFRFSHKEPVKVMADASALVNSVLCNILTNAAKFSNPHGNVYIEIHHQGSTVELKVTDEGIGMPENIKENIFSHTYMTHRPGTDKEKGTGLGMPIVKMFMEFFHGDIQVDSTEAHNPNDPSGTTFTLIFKAG